MKYSIYVLILVMLNASDLLANPPDSIGLDTKAAIVNAGWLQDFRGAPTQWMNVNGARAEVAGYVSVNRKIRFYNNRSFEIDVYKQPPYHEIAMSPNDYDPCRARKGDNEILVITGTWSVKKDSVYLIYKKEKVYGLNPYLEYQSIKGSSESPQSIPKALCKCKLRKRETYLWRDGKICMVASMDICFK